MLPSKRIRPKSGISRGPKRFWPRHERWVRAHNCCVPHCIAGPIDFAHIRNAANSGTGLKPFSWDGISLCHGHHMEAHDIGHETFAKRYGIDLYKLAAEFAARSPDLVMKEAMREAAKL